MLMKAGVHEGRKILSTKVVYTSSYSSAKSIAITRYLKKHKKTKRKDVTATVTKSPIHKKTFFVFVLTRKKRGK